MAANEAALLFGVINRTMVPAPARVHTEKEAEMKYNSINTTALTFITDYFLSFSPRALTLLTVPSHRTGLENLLEKSIAFARKPSL